MNRKQFERAIRSALIGPELKQVRFGAHEFNVKRLQATVSGSTVKVLGRLSHHRTLQGDEQIRYEAVIRTARGVQIKPVRVTLRQPLFARVLGTAWDVARLPVEALLSGPLPPGVTVEELATHAGLIGAGKLFAESAGLLDDGDWEGEALFLISNILGRLGLAATVAGSPADLPLAALRFDPFRPTHTAPPATPARPSKPSSERAAPPATPRPRHQAPPARPRRPRPAPATRSR